MVMLRLCATCEPEGRCRGACGVARFQPGRDLGCVIQGPCVTCGRTETMPVRGYDDRGHAYAHLCSNCLRAEQQRAPFVLAEKRQGESALDRQERGREAERDILRHFRDRSVPPNDHRASEHCICEMCVGRRQALRELMAVADSVPASEAGGQMSYERCRCWGCGRELSYDYAREDYSRCDCGRAAGRCHVVGCRGPAEYGVGRFEGAGEPVSYAVCGACLHDLRDGVEVQLRRSGEPLSDEQLRAAFEVIENSGIGETVRHADRARPDVERLAAMGYQPRGGAPDVQTWTPQDDDTSVRVMRRLREENDELRRRVAALVSAATPYRGGQRQLPVEERVRLALDELTRLGVDVDFECDVARWGTATGAEGQELSDFAIQQFITARQNGYDVRAIVVQARPEPRPSWWRRAWAWVRGFSDRYGGK